MSLNKKIDATIHFAVLKAVGEIIAEPLKTVTSMAPPHGRTHPTRDLKYADFTWRWHKLRVSAPRGVSSNPYVIS
jgi:hypothetical protein